MRENQIVSGAEERSFITRLLALIALGLTLSLAKSLVRIKREMEANEVVRDVEAFIRVQRLQDLILPEDKTIISWIESAWSNEGYRKGRSGGLEAFTPIRLEEWLKQTLTDTLSP